MIKRNSKKVIHDFGLINKKKKSSKKRKSYNNYYYFNYICTPYLLLFIVHIMGSSLILMKEIEKIRNYSEVTFYTIQIVNLDNF
jgi:hypothetical protein